MSYCSNCGAKREFDEKVCSLCGNVFQEEQPIIDKDARIRELEQKLAHLEQNVIKDNPKKVEKISPWIFITPLAFMIIFLGFFFLIVWVG